MKKMFALLLICTGLIITGCADNPSPDLKEIFEETMEVTNHSAIVIQAPSGDLVEIKEKMFVAQTNDIYINAEDYLGKTIKYEGIFDIYESPETAEVYYSVIRYGPGCCGIDANAGFEVIWNGEGEYPNDNEWVEAVGILEEFEENGYLYLRLALTSLTVLPTRGAAYVSQ
jgi:Predicted membrane protein